MPYCYDCGNKIEIEDNFCQKCGRKLVEPSEPNSILVTKDTDFDSGEVTPDAKLDKNTKPKSWLIAIPVVVILVIGFLFFGRSNFDANNANAVEIANWMIKNGYCSEINKERPNPSDKGIERLVQAYDQKLYRICSINSENGQNQNPDLLADYSKNKHVGYVVILVGSGRMTFKQEDKVVMPKYINYVVGDNWYITFHSYESIYSGSISKVKTYMSEIAKKLNGKLSVLHRPNDYCAFVQSYLDEPDLETNKRIQDELSDCIKYSPDSLSWNQFETWTD